MDDLSREEAKLFQQETGRCIYIAIDRYDVQFVVRLLTQFLSKPRRLDMMRLHHLVKYLAGTRNWSWLFAWQRAPEKGLLGDGDSDWAANSETRRSVSSGLIMYGVHCLEHWVQGQQVVSLSSGEPEFYAAGSVAVRLLFFSYLFLEVGKKVAAVLRSDSSAARGVLKRAGPGRIRHLQVRFLWVQERVAEGSLAVEPVLGAWHTADLGTKILDGKRVKELAAQTSLRPSRDAGQSLRVLMLAILVVGARGARPPAAPAEGALMVLADAELIVDAHGIAISWKLAVQILIWFATGAATLIFG